ncbi:MAG: helix-turn-helix domain-containing protein [Beijerinckiaceae bacterium]
MFVKKSPNFVDRHVGSRVRLRRMLLGLSQEKLGDALGLTFQQVQKYEKGTNRIGASRLQQIANFLKVEVAFFFEGVSGQGAPAGGFAEEGTAFVMEFLNSNEGLQLNRAFARIKDARVKRRIIALVNALANVEEPDEAPVPRPGRKPKAKVR